MSQETKSTDPKATATVSDAQATPDTAPDTIQENAPQAAPLVADDADDAGTAAQTGNGMTDEDKLAEEWARALAESEQGAVQKKKTCRTGLETRSADFPDMSEDARMPRPDTDRHDLDFILDIPLEVSVELGRARLLINELLQLGQGSVVELTKLAGEPLEVYVNGKLVARGEAVVINEKFGVRLTDIISPTERVKQLG